MRSSIRNRFTVYDAMDARGEFEKNPANADAMDRAEGVSLYKGPVPYPKMFYHPKGEERIINPGETIMDPIQGAIKVGVLKEIIWEMAQNEDDEKRLRAAGWHDHPSRAIAAGGGEAPPISSDQRIAELQAQLAALTGELQVARGERMVGGGEERANRR